MQQARGPGTAGLHGSLDTCSVAVRGARRAVEAALREAYQVFQQVESPTDSWARPPEAPGGRSLALVAATALLRVRRAAEQVELLTFGARVPWGPVS